MKNRFLCFLYLITLAVISGCPSGHGVLEIDKFELPPIFVSPTEESTVAKHDFVFLNRSENEVVLEASNVTCGCTRFSVTPEKVAPSKQSIIEISYDLSCTLSKRSESVIVNYDQKHKKSIRYTLNSRTYPRLEVNGLYDRTLSCVPGKDIQIDILCRGFVPVDETSEDKLVIESSSDLLNVIDPDNVQCQKKDFNEEAKVFEKKYKLNLVSPDWTDAKFNSEGYSSDLTISYGPHIIKARISWIPIQKIMPDKHILFFNCLIEPAKTEQVVINSDDPFKITEVRSLSGGTVVSYDKDRNDTRHILNVIPDIKSISNQTTPNNSDTIVIFTNHPLQPQVKINVHFMLPHKNEGEEL